MVPDIQISLDNLLKKNHFATNDISNFGKEIAPLMVNLPINDVKSTVDDIFKSLLRKGSDSFRPYNASNYSEFMALDLYTGISDGVKNIAPVQENTHFMKSISVLLSKKVLNDQEFIVKEVAVNLTGEKITHKNISSLANNLTRHIVFNSFNYDENGKYIPHHGLKPNAIKIQPIVEFWKQVKAELTLTNQIDILDKLEKKVNLHLDSNDYLENNPELKKLFTTTLSQGFSDSLNTTYEDKNTVSTRIAQIRKNSTTDVTNNIKPKK